MRLLTNHVAGNSPAADAAVVNTAIFHVSHMRTSSPLLRIKFLSDFKTRHTVGELRISRMHQAIAREIPNNTRSGKTLKPEQENLQPREQASQKTLKSTFLMVPRP